MQIKGFMKSLPSESDGHPPNLTLRSHADVKIKGNQCMSRGYFAINSPVINNFLNNILPQMHRLFFLQTTVMLSIYRLNI